MTKRLLARWSPADYCGGWDSVGGTGSQSVVGADPGLKWEVTPNTFTMALVGLPRSGVSAKFDGLNGHAAAAFCREVGWRVMSRRWRISPVSRHAIEYLDKWCRPGKRGQATGICRRRCIGSGRRAHVMQHGGGGVVQSQRNDAAGEREEEGDDGFPGFVEFASICRPWDLGGGLKLQGEYCPD